MNDNEFYNLFEIITKRSQGNIKNSYTKKILNSGEKKNCQKSRGRKHRSNN